MKVLITGSSGYLGTLLTNYLTTRKIPVTGIGHRKIPAIARGDYFKYYSCDVADKVKLASIFLEEQPSHIIHLASTFNKVRDHKREYSVDIGGSKNILEISDSTPSVRQLIYSSSAVAYGGQPTNPEWIPESYPLSPGKYRYGLNKSKVEELFSSALVRKDLHVLSLRICQVIGPSVSNDRNFLKLLIKSPVLPRICMKNKIQLLHEADFLALMEKILHDDEIEGTFNMAPDDFASILELAPDKLYLPLPVSFISGVLWVLWNMRLLNLQSASVNNAIFPIIIDPARIIKRYDYKFRYTTAEAFSEAMLNDKTFPEALHRQIPADYAD